METVDEAVTFFVWDGDTMVQEVHPDSTVTYLFEPESFVPMAQVHSDVADNIYDPEVVKRKWGEDEQQRAAEELERENLKWLKVTDANAYRIAVEVIEQRKQQESIEARKRREGEAEADRIYFINTDHLGTPQEATSEDGKVVWLAKYKAWGGVRSFDKGEITQPWRFQGQFSDEETGLLYNRYRYYDPDSARYLTQDPIGLMGGENLYGYAANPTGWMDPLGLTKCPGIPITNNSARKLLKSRGLSKQQQHEVVTSFDDQIYASHGHAGEQFTITESVPGAASGVFVTRCSAGSTPAERRQKLALPPSNTAEVESPVALARNQVLLEGKVAPQLQWGTDKTGGGWQVVTAGGKYTGAIKR
jgi:RHS repeat-associated protein